MRRSLDDLPAPNLSPGYSMRACTPADSAGLGRVLSESFEEEWSVERARNEFFENPTVYKTFAIEHDGELVATASAQMYPDNAPDMGTIHWVGAMSSHGGRRLGYEVCLAVLHELRAMGCTVANLTTDDPRLPAIRTYFKLGFEPYDCDPSHEARWKAVIERLEERRG